MKKLPLAGTLLLCSLICPRISPAQTASKICLEAPQARLIGNSLRKYEALKPAYQQLRTVNQQLYVKTGLLSSQVSKLDSAYATSQRAQGLTQVLYQDSQVKAAAWKARARNRNLKFFGVLSLVVLYVVAGLKH